MTELTHEELLRVLHYDPQNGHFTWRVTYSKAVAGARAGWLNEGGKRRKPCWRLCLSWRKYTASRLAWFYMTGHWPVEVDHRNLDPLDDSWGNLREATRSQNEANKGVRRNNKLGLKGVDAFGGGYRAQIMRNRRKVYLGTFPMPAAAQRAYLAAAAAADGEFLRAA